MVCVRYDNCVDFTRPNKKKKKNVCWYVYFLLLRIVLKRRCSENNCAPLINVDFQNKDGYMRFSRESKTEIDGT